MPFYFTQQGQGLYIAQHLTANKGTCETTCIRIWIGFAILSGGSLLGITRLCRVMTNNDPRDRFVYPIHKRMLDSFSSILLGVNA